MSEWKGIEEEARGWLAGEGYGEGRVLYSSKSVQHPTRDSLAALIRRAMAHGVRLCAEQAEENHRALVMHNPPPHDLPALADAIERGDANV